MDALWRKEEKGGREKWNITSPPEKTKKKNLLLSILDFSPYFVFRTHFISFLFSPYFPFGSFCCVLPLIISQHTHSNPHTQESITPTSYNLAYIHYASVSLGVSLSGILHITIFKYSYFLFFILSHPCCS